MSSSNNNNNLSSNVTMADVQPSMSNLDYLNAPLDFEDGFGFSPATSPVRDPGKQDFGGYFSNAMDDPLPGFLDPQSENDFFNNYGSASGQQSSHPSAFSTINSKVVHGQVTPPSDNSPVAAKQEMDTEPTPVTLDDATNAPATRKKRGSQQSQTSQASTAPSTKRRKNSARKSSTDTNSGGEEKDEKRSKFLERNRVAASKCRQKKKEWTNNLEQRARDLQQNKTHLSLLVNSLRDEVLYLKGEVLKHDNCNCTALRNYMSRSVSQISGEVPTPIKPQPASDPSLAGELDLDGMSFSGSPDLSQAVDSPLLDPSMSPTT